jgi:peptide methionine sulfoxide reductase msrA/msrB
MTFLSVSTCILMFAVTASLISVRADEKKLDEQSKTAVLGGGCFWCTETDFEHCPGVIDVVSGYSGGTTENPNYSTYHDGHHTECALITYDPKKVTFGGLVEWLVKHIDPTDAGGQFYDRGDGYKPIVFYENEEEKEAAQKVFDAIDAKKVFDAPIKIELAERSKFWPAEDYHQNYHKTNAAHYRQYRTSSGRNNFVKKAWGKKADTLELPGSIPKGTVSKGVIKGDNE